jgi:hypothetical protein
VYVNLFGAGFLPLAKPLMAGFTTLTILLAWWWMEKKPQSSNNELIPLSSLSGGC